MKKILLVAVMLVLAVGLVACGGGTVDNADGNADGNEGRVLVMATNAEFEPFEYLDESGQPTGFDVDLFQALCEQMGATAKVEDMLFDAVVIAVQEGKADMGLAGLSIEPDRLKEVNFSDYYYTAGQAIIVMKEGSTVASVADLDGKSIGVQLGTTSDTCASKGDYGNLDVQQYNKNADAIQDLINGRVDAVIMDNHTAKAFSERNDQVAVLDELLTEESYAIAIAKGNEALLEEVNQALAALKENGILQSLIDKYNLGAEQE
ncbi:MAG: basic amino acid ABC transporter substrate-binding protein [Clostridiales bacterium]